MKSIAALAICAALTTGFAGIAVAKEHYRENSVKADTKDAYEQLADSVRREMAPGGKYEFIKPDEKPKVDKALDEMTKLFDEHDTVAAMTQDRRDARVHDLVHLLHLEVELLLGQGHEHRVAGEGIVQDHPDLVEALADGAPVYRRPGEIAGGQDLLLPRTHE